MTGHPLLGPSVIEAIYSGCVYINPIYSPSPLLGRFASQHPYAADKIGTCMCGGCNMCVAHIRII